MAVLRTNLSLKNECMAISVARSCTAGLNIDQWHVKAEMQLKEKITYWKKKKLQAFISCILTASEQQEYFIAK